MISLDVNANSNSKSKSKLLEGSTCCFLLNLCNSWIKNFTHRWAYKVSTCWTERASELTSRNAARNLIKRHLNSIKVHDIQIHHCTDGVVGGVAVVAVTNRSRNSYDFEWLSLENASKNWMLANNADRGELWMQTLVIGTSTLSTHNKQLKLAALVSK